jgi:hypothetical protein
VEKEHPVSRGGRYIWILTENNLHNHCQWLSYLARKPWRPSKHGTINKRRQAPSEHGALTWEMPATSHVHGLPAIWIAAACLVDRVNTAEDNRTNFHQCVPHCSVIHHNVCYQGKNVFFKQGRGLNVAGPGWHMLYLMLDSSVYGRGSLSPENRGSPLGKRRMQRI